MICDKLHLKHLHSKKMYDTQWQNKIKNKSLTIPKC